MCQRLAYLLTAPLSLKNCHVQNCRPDCSTLGGIGSFFHQSDFHFALSLHIIFRRYVGGENIYTIIATSISE